MKRYIIINLIVIAIFVIFLFNLKPEFFRITSPVILSILGALSVAIAIVAAISFILYKHEQDMKLNKEKLLAKIIHELGEHENLPAILQEIINKTGIFFGADRAVINIIPTSKLNLSDNKEESYFQYLKNLSIAEFKIDENTRTLIKAFCELVRKNKLLVINNSDKNVFSQEIAEFYNQFNIKSHITTALEYKDNFYGILRVSQISHTRKWTNEEINNIKIISDLLSKGLYEKQLNIEIENKTYIEEQIKKILDIIRQNPEIDKVLKSLADEIGKLFNIDKVAIFRYRSELESKITLEAVYRASEQVPDPRKIIISPETAQYLSLMFQEGKSIVIDDITNSDLPAFAKEDGIKLGIKSIALIPIIKEENHWGFITLAQTQKIRKWSENDLALIQIIVNEIYSAIYISQLYSSLKTSSEREKLLRKITESIRSSLNLDETFAVICKEVAGLFNADRVVIVQFPNPLNYLEFIPRREYLSTNMVKGFSPDFDPRAGAFWGKNLLEKGIIIAIDNVAESDTPDYFKNNYLRMGIKSIINLPIQKDEDKWGTIGISLSCPHHWSENEINLIESIADQIYIAIKQAELFEETQKNAQKEALLRKIISVIRNSLDIDEVLRVISEETAKLVNADMIMIVEHPDKNDLGRYYIRQSYFPTGKIFISEPDKIDHRVPEFWARESLMKDIPIAYDNLACSKSPDYLKETYKSFGAKSTACIPIKRGEDSWGMLSIATAETRKWTENEISILTSIADQIYLAIRQSEVVAAIKQNAESEKLLREIVTELKLSENPDDIFSYILPKISQIFNVNRVFFVGFSKSAEEKPVVEYEFLNNQLPSLKGIKCPECCTNTLFRETAELKPVLINDTKTYQSENKDLQDFLEKNCIRSIMMISLVRYDHDIKILGNIVLTSENERNWTTDQLKLLENISGIIVSALWDVRRRQELEDLRNTFILTLAHDLQMPLVGERTTLEFLRSRKDSVEKYYKILDELIKDNQDTYKLLSRLIHSYNYESGKQKLYKTYNNIELLINESINKNQEAAQIKFLSINKEIQPNLPEVNVDRDEIITVIDNLLTNAIKYSYENGQVNIKAERQNNFITVCISDVGPGISAEARERIFDRFTMAQTIVRRFGSGFGLYLSRQIVEAHGGRIWLTSEPGKGATFCFSLPLT